MKKLYYILIIVFLSACGSMKKTGDSKGEVVADAPYTAAEGEYSSGADISASSGKDDISTSETRLEKSYDAKAGFSGEPSSAKRTIAESKSSVSGLRAGFSDDNKQYNYFIGFLDKYKSAKHFKLDVSERIILKISDADGKPVSNADVSVLSAKKTIAYGKTLSDGTFVFFPSDVSASGSAFTAEVSYLQKKTLVSFSRKGAREINVRLDGKRDTPKKIPLDMLFVMDTTGSMGEEIARLKQTIEIINANLASLSIKPAIRFGMVLYRDRGDEYVTRTIPFTDNLDKFQEELDAVSAGGGGDGPEDLQSALDDAVNKMSWNLGAIKLCYVITDAPPHLDYDVKYTYVDAVRDAKKKGIKIFSVGTGGLDIDGEYVLRQISQYTYGKYIFLTYGERGESEGGKEGSVSHHSGENFETDKLETIIIRFAKEELSNLTDISIDESDEYVEGKKIAAEKSEETLKKLFDMAFSQLVDYSTIKIEEKTPVSIIPFSTSDRKFSADAEYFTEQAGISLREIESFKPVERKDIQKILKELSLGETGIIEGDKASKVGNLLGAKIIITGNLYLKKDNYEIFVKMLRVETGEVLSVNKIRIDRGLGITK